MDKWAVEHDEKVVMQTGYSTYEPKHCEWSKFSTDRGYATSLDMRVYLWRDEVEGHDPVMTVEYKPEEWNPEYDIINHPEEFMLYVDGELIEYE